MINLKSTNIYYIIGIIPLISLAFIMGILLSPHCWLKVLLAAVWFCCTFYSVRKFLFLPRPKSEYSDLEPLELRLSIPYNVRLYTSKRMAEYSFLNRHIEVISPLHFKSASPLRIAVNPKLFEQEGEDYTRVAIVREIEKYRNKSQIKNVLGLTTPLLSLIVLVEMYFLFAAHLSKLVNSGALIFFAPSIGVLIILGTLFLWNKSISKQDFITDRRLLSFFSHDEIAQYIRRSEELLCGEEKVQPRTVQNHYAEERIKHLK